MPVERPDVAAPYPGLRPFEANEAEIFFGRETHTDRLLGILQRERFLAVIGPSGCGKSSLVRAGMLPALTAGWLGTGSQWRVAILRPGDQPVRRLARALLHPGALRAELSGSTSASSDDAVDQTLPLIEAELRRGPLGLLHLVKDARSRGDGTLSTGASPAAFNLLVLIDQFEELFRYTERGTAQADEADVFVDLLLRTRAEPGALIFIAITMRTDFLGHCVRFLELPEAINRGQYLTPRLTRDQLQEAIVGPARIFGGTVTADVANELINQITGPITLGFDQLPILQHALARMWESASRTNPQSPTIGRSELDEIGGVAQALDRHAENIWATLSPKQQEAAEHLFRSITERSRADISEGSRDVRRPQTLKQIAAAAPSAWSWEDFRPVVEAFSRQDVNFLTYVPPLDANTRIDISHEALIRHWRRLHGWVEEEGERAAEYRRWRERAGGELLTGRDLVRALAWRAGDGRWKPTAQWAARYAEGENRAGDFSKTVAYIEQSRRKRNRRRAYVAATVAVVLISGLSLGLRTFYLWQEAKLAEQEKFQSLLRAAAPRVIPQEAADSLAYLAVALRAEEDTPAARSLAVALLLNRSWPLPSTAPLHHDGPVVFADFGSDGRLVTASEDGSARIWDVRSGTQLGERMPHKGPVRSAVFSPDGARIVTASDDGTAHLWDAHSGAPLGKPMKHNRAVGSAVFSPDGKRVLTASDDGTAEIWDGDSGTSPGVILMHDGPVHFATFSADGDRVATASEDHTAQIWDARSGHQVGHRMRHDLAVMFVAFSPDDTRIVTTSLDKTARLWDARSGAPLGQPMQHGDGVGHAAFSPDGTRVVTTSVDHTARLWDARSGAPLGVPMQHQDTVRYAVFSTDGNSILTASDDGTVRYWDGHTGEPRRATESMRHDGPVFFAAFSPNDMHVVTASQDGTAQIWDPPTRAAAPLRIEHPRTVVSASFSPDGSHILTGSDDGRARLWDARSGVPFGQPIPHEQDKTVTFVAFSGDGARVITASQDGTIRIWDALSGAPMGPFLQHKRDSRVTCASLSPDDHRLVAASVDGTVTLWDADSGKPIGEAMKHSKVVRSVVFSPDGERIVTASDDGTARLWDAHSGTPLGKPMQHGDAVRFAAFSPDGKRVVTAAGDHTRLWDATSGAPIGAAMTHLDRVSAAAFSPDGTRIVTASRDRTARLWDAHSGAPIGEIMQHRDVVLRAAFSPDGTRVVTASEDRTARLWDGQSGVPLSDAVELDAAVRSAAFSPDGTRVVVASGNLAAVIDTPALTQEDQTVLADLAETVGGLQSNAERAVAPLSDRYQHLAKFRSSPGMTPSTSPLRALINWFFAAPETRPLSPSATLNVAH
jgi:WD40 repeat protein